MGVIATAVKHMLSSGMTPDDIVAAVADMEDHTPKQRSAGAIRQERYRRNKASPVTLSDVCDAGNEKEIPQTPKEKTTPLSPPKGGHIPPHSVEDAVKAYADMASRAGLAVPRAITPARRSKIASRLREHGFDVWLEAVQRVETSEFCRGKNDRGWRADLDFLLQDKSFMGLIEGKYGGEVGGAIGNEFCPDDWPNTRFLVSRFRHENQTDPPRAAQGGKAGYLIPAEWVAISKQRVANA